MNEPFISERARQILQLEPKTVKNDEARASFELPLNARLPLASVAVEEINSAHGTNFATIIQALRNTNGQIAPPHRLQELGIEPRTGESAVKNGSTISGPPFVAVGLLQAGFGLAQRYASIEAGHGEHIWGKPKRQVLSEASNIPVLAIGELLDPYGQGRAFQEAVFVNDPVWADDLPEGELMHGWGRARVGAHMDYMQALGERLNIRLLLTYDPEDQGRDHDFRDLIIEVITQIADEQSIDYSDVRVGSVDEFPIPLGGHDEFLARQPIYSAAQVSAFLLDQ